MGKTYLIQPVSTTDWRFGAKSVGGGKSGVEGYGGKGVVVSGEWQVVSGGGREGLGVRRQGYGGRLRLRLRLRSRGERRSLVVCVEGGGVDRAPQRQYCGADGSWN